MILQFGGHTIGSFYILLQNHIHYIQPRLQKKKYYNLIQNLPIFIPIDEIGNYFSQLLDKYPVTPYLDNRDSFVRWMHFIHNKINIRLGKQELSLPRALELYREEYKPKPIYLAEKINWKRHYLLIFIIAIMLALIYIWYE